MSYEHTQKIGERFDQAVALIRDASYNARQLTEVLGVSRPTVHRIIVDLRRRGYVIRAVRDGSGWHYELAGKTPPETPKSNLKRETNEDVF